MGGELRYGRDGDDDLTVQRLVADTLKHADSVELYDGDFSSTADVPRGWVRVSGATVVYEHRQEGEPRPRVVVRPKYWNNTELLGKLGKEFGLPVAVAEAVAETERPDTVATDDEPETVYTPMQREVLRQQAATRESPGVRVRDTERREADDPADHGGSRTAALRVAVVVLVVGLLALGTLVGVLFAQNEAHKDEIRALQEQTESLDSKLTTLARSFLAYMNAITASDKDSDYRLQSRLDALEEEAERLAREAESQALRDYLAKQEHDSCVARSAYTPGLDC